AAGVGVDLGDEHQDVDVAAGGEHMIQAAVADVVGPAVAADDPDALAHQRIADAEELVDALRDRRLPVARRVAGRYRLQRRQALLQLRDALALRGDPGLGRLVRLEQRLYQLRADLVRQAGQE